MANDFPNFREIFFFQSYFSEESRYRQDYLWINIASENSVWKINVFVLLFYKKKNKPDFMKHTGKSHSFHVYPYDYNKEMKAKVSLTIIQTACFDSHKALY